MNKTAKLSAGRTVGAILLAVAVLIAAQILSQLLASLLAAWGCPAFLCNVLAGILYPVLTLAGLLPVCRKVLKVGPAQCRIPAFSLSPVWIVCAVLMPAAVCGAFLLLPGRWEAVSMPDTPALICAAVFYLGLGTGVVEEAVFRGVLLTAVERRWNRFAAVLAPSAAFAALHLAGSPLDLLSALQLLAAGTAVGVLFSLVTLASGGIWASALMHGLWNIVMIGGIVHIGPSGDPSSLFSYVTDTHSRLLTGGEFGVEASLFATAAYILFMIPALRQLSRQKDPAPSSR